MISLSLPTRSHPALISGTGGLERGIWDQRAKGLGMPGSRTGHESWGAVDKSRWPPRAGGEAAAALPCLALGWWEAGQPVEMGSWLQQEGRGTVTTMIAPTLSQPMWGTLHLRLHLLFWPGKHSHRSSQRGHCLQHGGEVQPGAYGPSHEAPGLPDRGPKGLGGKLRSPCWEILGLPS